MKDFGYNVFNATAPKPATQDEVSDVSTFSSMTLKVNENDGSHPDRLDTSAVFDRNKIENYVPEKKTNFGKVKFVYAQIIGKYKKFDDGDLVSFELNENLQVGNNFVSKGTVIQWPGWKIDDRIYIDLGFDHNVILYDLQNTHGISFASLKKKESVIIMVNTIDD
jgi:hypothetical protein